MITGRGLLASAIRLIDNDKYLFYVNGISNSVINFIPESNAEFIELNQFAHANEKRTLVYFSTSQVNSSLNHHRPYVQHKCRIEDFIKDNFDSYLIIRTSNLVGSNPWNSHTLFNFLYNALITGDEITINKKVIRNILDVDDFVAILNNYLENNLQKNNIVEIDNPVSYTMDQIVQEFEKFFSKKFILNESESVEEFAVFELDKSLSAELWEKARISTENYIPRLLKKYYKPVLNRVHSL